MCAKKAGGWTLALLLAVLVAAPAQAATDVLTLVPGDSLGFVVVRRLATTNGKLQQLAGMVKAPLPSPLQLLKLQSGIKEGLAEEGSAMLALMPREGWLGAPRPVAALPVSDYAKFVAQLGGDASQPSTQVTIGGQQLLAGKKDAYAVLVEADNEKTLRAILDGPGQAPPAIGALQPWLAENDAAVVVLPAGVKLGLDKAIQAMATVKQGLRQNQPSKAQAEQVAAALDMYTDLFRFCRQEINLAAAAVHVDAKGNVRWRERFQFAPGGQLAKITASAATTPTGLLVGLPDEPFVVVGGAAWSTGLTEQMMKWSLSMMQRNPGMYGLGELSDQQVKQLLETSMASMKDVRAMGLWMAPGSAGDPVYSNLVFTMKTRDSQDFLVNYRKYIDAWNKMTQGAAAMKFELAESKIGGQQALRLSMDMGQMLAAQAQGDAAAQEKMQQLMAKMFGSGGKMTIYLVPVDKTTVASGFGSEAEIARLVEAMRNGASDASGNASIAKTARLLPDHAGVAFFASPRGVMAWVNRLVNTLAPPGAVPRIPEFPETAPIGCAIRLAPSRLETETVVPAEILQAAAQYIAKLRS